VINYKNLLSVLILNMRTVVGLILIISACARVVYVDKVDVIEVDSGEHLDLIVASNPSTGYTWVWSSESSPNLQTQNGYTGEFIPPENPMPGAPGKQLFHVNVNAFHGETLKIVLKYQRPWEDKPEEVKEITLKVN
jgi:predicted secreted protein